MAGQNKQLLSRFRHAQAVFFLYPPRVLRRGGVRAGRAGGDHIQRVAQDIGKDHGLDEAGPADLGEAAALDLGKALADGVDFHDVRAAGQQLAGDILQFLRRDERLFKQRAAAAGEEEEHRVLFRQVRHEIQRRPGAPEGVFIRYGMAGLEAGEVGDGAHHMIVFGDDHAVFDPVAEAVGGGFRHLPGRLAGGHQQHPARELPAAQGALHGRVRLDGRDGLPDDPVRMVT